MTMAESDTVLNGAKGPLELYEAVGHQIGRTFWFLKDTPFGKGIAARWSRAMETAREAGRVFAIVEARWDEVSDRVVAQGYCVPSGLPLVEWQKLTIAYIVGINDLDAAVEALTEDAVFLAHLTDQARIAVGSDYEACLDTCFELIDRGDQGSLAVACCSLLSMVERASLLQLGIGYAAKDDRSTRSKWAGLLDESANAEHVAFLRLSTKQERTNMGALNVLGRAVTSWPGMLVRNRGLHGHDLHRATRADALRLVLAIAAAGDRPKVAEETEIARRRKHHLQGA